MPMFEPRWEPTGRLDRAFALARTEHARQSRKSNDGEPGIPYISHLMAVSALVMENGGTEDQAIAGLLHDLVEDTGLTFDDVEKAFGPGVARIVRACTDTDEVLADGSKLPWPVRKRKYLDDLAGKRPDDSSLLVALADKVHNATTTERELRGLSAAERTTYFGKFNAGEADQREWYEGLAAAFLKKATDGGRDTGAWAPLARQLDDLVRRMFP